MQNGKTPILQTQPIAQRKGGGGGFFGRQSNTNPFFSPVQKKTAHKQPIQRQGWEGAASEAACALLTDEQLYQMFLNTYFLGQPNAKRHLIHYRTGGGADYTENVAQLFAANPRVAARIAGLIGGQFRGEANAHGAIIGGGDDGRGSDTPPIRQSDYDSTDWRNANGNIDEVQWRLIGQYTPGAANQFEITIIDPYAWHQEEGRATQCIHAAMERLKRHGAADYMTRGTATVTLEVYPYNDRPVTPIL